ncbi:MAG TPA: TetR/AcrR family transcriptional regulator [Candidatus Binataceae bacterium]|nr:TetR/AcrR family transcriptional regulator [Candidatus Binataceae bacterium]
MASQPQHPDKRSPSASPSKPGSVRERILETARASFYREGIRAVGVDTLIARSGVAKMSFYRSFRSKDDLVCAYLESSAAEYWRWWDETIRPHEHAPRKQLRALFAATADKATSADFRGCPFGNTLVEFPEEGHPARAVIVRFKAERHARLRELARAAGARDPERLADQLDIVLEGSRFCSESARPAACASGMVRAAETLIGAETRHG